MIGVFNEKDDAADSEPMEEVDIVQIGDVVVDRVGFKDAKSALVTLITNVGTKTDSWYTSHA